jgi:hypothetical protein
MLGCTRRRRPAAQRGVQVCGDCDGPGDESGPAGIGQAEDKGWCAC